MTRTDAARLFAMLGAASGGLAVAAGAFGAHALKTSLAPEALAVFDTAARYQMYHALALLAAAWAAERAPGPAALLAGWSFLAGTLLFCGSLYALTFSGIKALGAITPLGGGAFLLGWVALAVSLNRRPGQ